MDTYLRDFAAIADGFFFCRAVDGIMNNRRFCQYCPLAGTDERGRCTCTMVSENFNRQFPDFEGSTPEMLKAYRFSETAHRGQLRKGTKEPYFVHLLESAGIVSQITKKSSVIMAALLHDVIEDTTFGYEDIENEFGAEVAGMVQAVSEDKRRDKAPGETWFDRKADMIARLNDENKDVKTIVLADKLSNIRATYEEMQISGDAIWQKFNQKDKEAHAWYYNEMVMGLQEFEGEPAYQELCDLVSKVFD